MRLYFLLFFIMPKPVFEIRVLLIDHIKSLPLGFHKQWLTHYKKYRTTQAHYQRQPIQRQVILNQWQNFPDDTFENPIGCYPNRDHKRLRNLAAIQKSYRCPIVKDKTITNLCADCNPSMVEIERIGQPPHGDHLAHPTYIDDIQPPKFLYSHNR
jgi:hypothetical protein